MTKALPGNLRGWLSGTGVLLQLACSACTLTTRAPAGSGGNASATPVASAAAPEARERAANAIRDAIQNFWVGDADSGHITPTWWGYPSYAAAVRAGEADPNVLAALKSEVPAGLNLGFLWGRGTVYTVLFNQWRQTKDPSLRKMLQSDWSYVKQNSRAENQRSQGAKCTPTLEWQLTEVGVSSTYNFATDDASWNINYLLQVYQATQDPSALRYAEEALRKTNAYFVPLAAVTEPPATGASLGACPLTAIPGVVRNYPKGMRYGDTKTKWGDGGVEDATKFSSLNEASFAIAALQAYQLDPAHPTTMRELALNSYAWIEATLLSQEGDTAGLYWMENYFESYSPGDGQTLPPGPLTGQVGVAGSATSLYGNMAMALLHARLYRLFGSELYRQRAVRTVQAILGRLMDQRGVFLDDRDGWANGTFAYDFACEVLSLPGMPSVARDAVSSTSRLNYLQNRSADGLYGADWGGPLPGQTRTWLSATSTRPEQVMTSMQVVNTILAAQCL